MIRFFACAILLGATAVAVAESHSQESGLGQDEIMAALQAAMTPGEEHARLARSTGRFDAVVRNWSHPGAEVQVSQSQVVRAMELNGRVLREVWTGEVMGMPFQGIGRTGYDNVTGRYWTTWTDNLSTGIYVAYGHWDEDSGRLVFDGTAVDPLSRDTIATRTVVTYPEEGAEHIEMFQTHEGTEFKAMEFALTRR